MALTRAVAKIIRCLFRHFTGILLNGKNRVIGYLKQLLAGINQRICTLSCLTSPISFLTVIPLVLQQVQI